MNVTIKEMVLRDGFQDEEGSERLTIEDRLHFIDGLEAAGLRNIEAGSFVRAARMAHTPALAEKLRDRKDGAQFSYLVPNEKGMLAAIEAGVSEIAVFVATSDDFSKKNINATVEESFARLAPVMALAKEHGIRVRGYLSTVFGWSDFAFDPARAVELTQRLLSMGAYEVAISDTSGIATSDQVAAVMDALEAAGITISQQIAVHFHDRKALATGEEDVVSQNVRVAYEKGVRVFDAATGGFGGCPVLRHEPGAPKKGNLDTLKLVRVLEGLGAETGIDINRLAQVGQQIMSRVAEVQKGNACAR
ncbi:MAG: hydroxymethylglutaryl-CoA lyase [Alphaproteobacteria bacterium]|nr:hydroxymethylglutaryl-CoA lyase [Alphaproteobacteria bacterium]